MRLKGRPLRPLLGALALLFLAACAKDAPQDYLEPAGPLAEKVDSLFRPVFWIATAIFFIVEGLFIVAIIKFRDRPGKADPKQIHGNAKAEIAWTIAPALLMLGVAIPTVVTIFDIQPKRTDDQLTVKVVGKQWWWEYEYLDTDPKIITANELVIPTDRQVFLELESSDVIHSFWVPKLAGKQDVVPGRTNTMTLIATEPGEYYGQCAEFCSVSHANMRLRVRAMEPTDFDAWVADMAAPAVQDSSVSEGRDLFVNNCAICHQIRGPGDEYASNTGPNLTHFAERKTFGAATFDLGEEDLIRWVANARALKPGVIMPVFEDILSEAEIRSIVAYLLTLE
ncbi:MAG: cytochrome c oxidase subunit II [Actinomycetota bacterium]